MWWLPSPLLLPMSPSGEFWIFFPTQKTKSLDQLFFLKNKWTKVGDRQNKKETQYLPTTTSAVRMSLIFIFFLFLPICGFRFRCVCVCVCVCVCAIFFLLTCAWFHVLQVWWGPTSSLFCFFLIHALEHHLQPPWGAYTHTHTHTNQKQNFNLSCFSHRRESLIHRHSLRLESPIDLRHQITSQFGYCNYI